MTGCMYVLSPQRHPEGNLEVPVLIADTMATLVDYGHAPITVPANVTSADVGQISRVRLVRKSYIIDDRIAVAFAGEGAVIEAMLRKAAKEMPAELRKPRPMDWLTDLANRTKGVEVVGFAINPQTSVLNYISPLNSRVEFPRLGRCAIIGSGAETLKRWAGRHDEALADDKLDAHNRVRAFALIATASSLAAEVAGNLTDWGGYLERITLSPLGDRFVRGARAAHFFLLATRLPGDRATTRLVQRVIAYDPNEDHGRVLSVSFGPNGIVGEFILDNVLRAPTTFDLMPTEDFWRDWSPDEATVTTVMPDPVHGSSVVHYVLVNQRDGSVVFEFTPGRFRGGLSTELIDEISGPAVAAWGAKYVPARDLSEGELAASS